MVFVWMLKGPFGMQMWATSGVCACAKGVKSCKRWRSTVAVSPVCSAVRMARRSLCWQMTGADRQAWAIARVRVKC